MKERGNVFTMILGGIVLSGALSIALYQLMGGPMLSTVGLAKKTGAEAQSQMTARMVIADAMNQTVTDCDADGSIEPRAWRTPTGAAPTGGGWVPLEVGAPVTDAWGTEYGYCVWDVGSYNDPALNQGTPGCGANANRLKGSGNPTMDPANAQTVVAVVSAGPDRTFQTTCSAYVDANSNLLTTTAGSDDIVARFSYSQASQATSSLWNLKAGTPSIATINKDLEVGNGTDTGGITASSLTTRGKIVAGGASKLGTEADVTVCDPGHAGLMRYNTAGPSIEYCDGSGWTAVTNGDASATPIVVEQVTPKYTEDGSEVSPDRSVTFGTLPTAGNTIVVMVSSCYRDGLTVTAADITDNQPDGTSGSYVEAAANEDQLPNRVAKIFYRSAIAAPGGSFKVTVNSTDDTLVTLGAMEVSGLAATPADQTGKGAATTGATSTDVAVDSSTSQANELAVAVLSSCSGNANENIQPAVGWTQDIVENDGATYSAASFVHKVLAATSTISHTWSHAASTGDTAAAIATFKGAAAGNGTATGEAGDIDSLSDAIAKYESGEKVVGLGQDALKNPTLTSSGGGGGGGGGGGAGIAFRGSNKATAGGGAVTVNKPAGTAEGDLLLYAVNVDDGDGMTVSWPAGFNQLKKVDGGGVDGQAWAVAYKIATAAEPASYTANPGVNNVTGIVAAYSGVSATSPIDVTTTESHVTSNGSGSPWTLRGSITTASPGDMVVWIGAADTNNGNNRTLTAPAGYTSRESNASGNWSPMMLADKIKTTAGATGNVDGTLTDANGGAQANGGAMMVALRPANFTPQIVQTLPMEKWSDGAVTFSNPVTAGDAVIVVIGGFKDGANFNVTNVTDSGGAIYTRAYVPAPQAYGERVFVYYRTNVTAPPNPFTVNVFTNATGPNDAFNVAALEVAGLHSSPIDQTNSEAQAPQSGSSTIATTGSTSQPNELAISTVTMDDGPSGNYNFTPGAGWTMTTAAGDNMRSDCTCDLPMAYAYQVLSAQGTISNTWTHATSVDRAVGIVTFKGGGDGDSGGSSGTDLNSTAVGYEALKASTTATNNTALGYRALTAATTGSGNLGVGSLALSSLLNGAYNIGIGKSALAGTTSGNYNTGIGSSALAANTTGSYNLAVGTSALASNTGATGTGSNDTAIGYEALTNLNAASPLTAIGYRALKTVQGAAACDLTTLASGQQCGTTNIVYVGTSGGNRIYTTLADQGVASWNNGSGYTTGAGGASSNSDGLTNTNSLVANTGPGSPYRAASLCRALGPDWYLPAPNELNLLYTKRTTGALNGTFVTNGDDYWSSYEYIDGGSGNGYAGRQRFNDGYAYEGGNSAALHVRCVWRGTGGISQGANNAAFGYSALTADTTGSNNAAIGYSTLLTNQTGSDNVAMGYNALKLSTVSSLTAFGYSALANNSTGAQNTAFGTSALAANTTGAGNTVFGFEAMKSGQTGNYNTGFGSRALALSTANGSGNTGIGSHALEAGGGDANTAFGSHALAANGTGGDYNVAVGARALAALNGQDGNTAFGYEALQNSTVAGNTAFGYQALKNNTTGLRLTAFGYQSLMSNTTGNDNTAFGAQTLMSNTGGSKNTAAGYQALMSNGAGTGQYAPIVVRQYTPTQTHTSSVAESSATFETAPAQNDTIIVLVEKWDPGVDLAGADITDNQGGTSGSYSRAVVATGCSTQQAAIFYRSGISAPTGDFTVTITPSVPLSGLVWRAMDVEGLATASALDSTGTGSSNAGATSTAATASATTTQPNELAVGGIVGCNGGFTGSSSWSKSLGSGGGDMAGGCDLSSLDVGEKCPNADVVYAGLVNGHRVYTNTTDISARQWSGCSGPYVVTGATSTTNGMSNTNTLVSLSDACSPYSAALACRALGSDWYLPASAELSLLYTVRNTGALSGTFQNSFYWSSTEYDNTDAYNVGFSDGALGNNYKPNSMLVRCVRGSGVIAGGSSDGNVFVYKVIQNTGSSASHTWTHAANETGETVAAVIATFKSKAYGATDYGDRNTAMGYQALKSNTAGDDNTAAGVRALMSNTTGRDNTATGYEALQANTTGVENTAMGYQSMASNVTGTGNTAAGYQSLYSNTVGTYNTALGALALYSNTTGDRNTAIGPKTLYSNSAGSDNTAVGHQALYYSLSGRNTAVGEGALYSNVGGMDNSAFGYNALYNTNTGTASCDLSALAEGEKCKNLDIVYAGTSGGNRIYTTLGDLGGISWNNGTGSYTTTGASSESDGLANTNKLVGLSDGGAPYKAALACRALGEDWYLPSRDELNLLYTKKNTGALSGTFNVTGDWTDGLYWTSSEAAGPPNDRAWIRRFSDGSEGSNYPDKALPYSVRCVRRGTGVVTVTGRNTSDYNSAAGKDALYNNTTGIYNTAVGYRALYYNTAGSYNTAIGYNAGPAQGYASLNNTTAIGYNAKVYESNYIQLGDTNVTQIAGQVGWSTFSDRRIKKDIQDSDLAADFIMKLRPVSYRMIKGDGRLDYGFIAQDVEQALDGRVTNMVVRDNDPFRTYGLRSMDLLAPIVKTMQEQEKAEERQRQELIELRGRLEKLQAGLKEKGAP